jgi:hypothetical protein
MTLDQFIAKYSGKYIDYDGKYGFQCTDLMRQYLKEVCGFSPYIAVPSVTYAKEIYAKAKPTFFEKIPNGEKNFPEKGDIVVWKFYPGVTGWPGHVAVNITGAPMNLISFDQNWKTGTPCHRQLHNYKGVIGWLKPKKV